MYIIISYPYGEDLTEIDGADIVEWIDDETVAIEVDFNDLVCKYTREASREYYEAEGGVFSSMIYHVDVQECTFNQHKVLNLEAIEERLVDLIARGEI